MVIRRNMRGVLWMIIAGFWLAVMAGIIRHLSEASYSTITITAYRNIFAFPLVALWYFSYNRSIPRTRQLPVYCIAATASFLDMALWTAAIAMIPLAMVTGLSYTAPMFAALLAILIFKEKETKPRFFSLLLGFVGAIIIAAPDSNPLHFGSLIALMAAFCWSVENVTIKRLTQQDDVKTIIFYIWFVLMLFSVPAVLFFADPLGTDGILWIALLAISSILMEYALSSAYKQSEVVVVMPFSFASVLFVAGIGYYIFDEPTGITTFFGAAIIICASLYLAWKEKIVIT